MDGKIALEEHWAIPETIGDSASLIGDSSGWSNVEKRLLDTEDLRLAEMDKYGIEFSILSLNAPAIQAILDTKEAIETSQMANDRLAEEVAKHPDRFAAFAALPMQDPDAAARELARCINDLGFKGALVNGFTQRGEADSAVYYDVPEYRSFWAEVERLGYPFYLHPRTQIPTRAQVYEGHPWIVSAAWGFARETSIHALRLIGSGLFDECPNLQIVLGHMGERIPFDMWRIDHRIRKVPHGYPAKKEMSEYLRENFFVTTSGNFNDAAFHCAIDALGMDRIMFSVDYPFEDTVDGADWYDKTEMDETDRLRVGRQHAIDLFKLELG